MEFDFTVTVSVILAVCAIISPVITTFLNNRHTEKMKEIDNMQAKIHKDEDSIQIKFEVFANYVSITGKYIAYSSNEFFKEYVRYYPLTLLHMNDEKIANKMKLLDKVLSTRPADFIRANSLLEEIISDLKAYINKLS